MTMAQILTLTGASRATLYRWRATRDFPAPIRPGEYDEAQVRGWWEANRTTVGRWPTV